MTGKRDTTKYKFVKYFTSKLTGNRIPVYYGDKRFSQVREYNPKGAARAKRQASTLLRHYKGKINMSDPLIDPTHKIPTPKAMVATLWGFKDPVLTRERQRQVVKYAENLLKKHS